MASPRDLWKNLPSDALTEILGKLPVADCVRTGAVCRPWAEAFNSKLFSPNPNQAPWLMLAGLPGDEETTATFVDLADNKLFKLQLPADPPIRRRLWMGSADGWLVTVDDRSEMILLNPLTGSQIQLPPISTMSVISTERDAEGNITIYYLSDEECTEPFTLEEFRYHLYSKVVLSSSPAGNNDYMVMLIHHPNSTLAFARAGDTEWTMSPTSLEYSGFHDAIYHKGLFYTVNYNGRVQAWDPESSGGIFSEPKVVFCPPTQDYVAADENARRKFYTCSKYLVVVPCNGCILQVWRLHDADKDDHWLTVEFRVFRLDETLGEWIPLWSLGDHALFLGSNRSICICNRAVPGLGGNCIYFTEDLYELSVPERFRDDGICSLEDLTLEDWMLGQYTYEHVNIEHFFNCDSAQLNWPPSIWIVPNFF